MISVIYRAEIEIPEHIYRHLGHTSTYDRASLANAKHVEASGQDSYSKVFEWGEAPTRAQAEAFEQAWRVTLAEWEKQLS